MVLGVIMGMREGTAVQIEKKQPAKGVENMGPREFPGVPALSDSPVGWR